VADADLAADGVFGQGRFEGLDLAGGAAAVEPPRRQGGHAGGVIAAVFEPLEALDQPGRDGPRSYDADDAAHMVRFFRPPDRRGFSTLELSGA
jgi:hypothetical protein